MSAADEEECIFLAERVAEREKQSAYTVTCWEPTSELSSRFLCNNPSTEWQFCRCICRQRTDSFSPYAMREHSAHLLRCPAVSVAGCPINSHSLWRTRHEGLVQSWWNTGQWQDPALYRAGVKVPPSCSIPYDWPQPTLFSCQGAPRAGRHWTTACK